MKYTTLEELNNLTNRIIHEAVAVHQELGPELFEKIYQRCLQIALEQVGMRVEAEIPLPVAFRGHLIDDAGYRLDLLVEDTVILEIKSAKDNEVFEKQLITYLRLANKPCGLVLNFNKPRLTQGITRIKNGYLQAEPNTVPHRVTESQRNTEGLKD